MKHRNPREKALQRVGQWARMEWGEFQSQGVVPCSLSSPCSVHTFFFQNASPTPITTIALSKVKLLTQCSFSTWSLIALQFFLQIFVLPTWLWVPWGQGTFLPPSWLFLSLHQKCLLTEWCVLQIGYSTVFQLYMLKHSRACFANNIWRQK